MVEVEGDGNTCTVAQFLGKLDGSLGHVAQKGLVGILAGAFGDLQDHWRFGFHAGTDNGLQLLHVVEIVCRNGITAVDGVGKHLAGVYQS